MVYHLQTHQLILTEGGLEFVWSENIFQKSLDKLMVRKNGLDGSGNFFPENSIASPPERQLVFPLFPRAKE